jgi:hypothetical protein
MGNSSKDQLNKRAEAAFKSPEKSGSSSKQIRPTERPGAAAKTRTKGETELGRAEQLVREGQSIVMRQRTLVLALAKDQQNIKEAEQLLATFEATLNDLRKELYRINRGK